MEQIKLKDINLSSLERLSQQGTKSTVYRDGKKCIKILDKFYEKEKEALFRKFLDMDGIEVENVLLPQELIVSDGKLQGYTMDFFDRSISLSDRFMFRYVDCKKLFDYVYKASKILRDIHDNGIIFQDLSFENILVDVNGNVKFCDLDGCSYKGNMSPFISYLMKRFFVNYRKEQIVVCPNLDRISMMLSFFFIIYAKEIQKISKKQYLMLSDEISTLDNLKDYADSFIDRRNPIGEIPYLDEIINLDDDIVYDRDKQLSLLRRFFIK